MCLGTVGALLLASSSIAFFKQKLLARKLNNQEPESTLVAEGNRGGKEDTTMKIQSNLDSIAEITKAIGVSVITGVLTVTPCNDIRPDGCGSSH